MLANLGLICANQDRDDAGALALLERADAGYTRVGTRGDARAQGAERATKEALQRPSRIFLRVQTAPACKKCKQKTCSRCRAPLRLPIAALALQRHHC